MNYTQTVLSFTRAADFGGRRALRSDLLNALRTSEPPVIVDLAGLSTLDHEDIGLLLECVEQAAGRDTQLFLVAGSAAVRTLLDITRISSLVPVFISIEEAIQQDVTNCSVMHFPKPAPATSGVHR